MITCGYCGEKAEGNFAIHRDGMGIGPEVDLCNDCGGKESPTCSEIWNFLDTNLTHNEILIKNIIE